MASDMAAFFRSPIGHQGVLRNPHRQRAPFGGRDPLLPVTS